MTPAIHLKIVIICLFIERQNNEEFATSFPSSHPKAMLNLIASLHYFVTDFSFLFINLILFWRFILSLYLFIGLRCDSLEKNWKTCLALLVLSQALSSFLQLNSCETLSVFFLFSYQLCQILYFCFAWFVHLSSNFFVLWLRFRPFSFSVFNSIYVRQTRQRLLVLLPLLLYGIFWSFNVCIRLIVRSLHWPIDVCFDNLRRNHS